MNYREFVIKCFRKSGNEQTLEHATYGIAGEAGEIVEVVKKGKCYGRPLDKERLREELGDLYFYMEMMCERTGITMDEVKTGLVDKLTKRYKLDE